MQGARNLMVGRGLSASVYTEITDLEGELNGFVTYDRRVVKLDQARVRAANLALIDASWVLSSPALLKNDATYTVRAGLADAACYSFESVNFPGQFLRHQNSRVRNSVNDGTALMCADATWCARTGLTGGGVSLESYNFRGSYLRHFNAEVWISNGAGGPAYNTPTSWAPDSTWDIVARPGHRSGWRSPMIHTSRSPHGSTGAGRTL